MSGLLRLQVQGHPQLEAKIRWLKDGSWLTQVLDQGAALLFNRMRSRFLVETAPDGSKWIPSQAALRRAKTGRGGGTLFDVGKLFRSLQLYAEGPTTRAIGTNATSALGFPYPIVHQFGLGFPERQFLGFGDEDVQLMSDVVIKQVIDGLSKA